MVDFGNLVSVALLALLGAFLVQRFRVPRKIVVFLPILFGVVIVWAFGEVHSPGDIFSQGVASGLLAAGILHILQGVWGGGP